jgi:nitrite reductase (NADH) small subunit/3-phenylpropionate/trans-cinnamate dioxygenase ferredoxin subunit
MAEYVTVAQKEEIPVGQSKTVCVGTKLISIFHIGEEFFAIDDVCPHMGASLGQGTVHNLIVTCPWHGWRFRLTDGTWADSPRVKTGSYPVRIENESIQILIENGQPRLNRHETPVNKPPEAAG